TGHLQLLADDPEQRRIVRRLDGHIPSVDIEIRHVRSRSGVGGRLRRQLTFGYWPAPTGSMPVGAQNDTEPDWRQCNLELLEENSVLELRLCAAATHCRPRINASGQNCRRIHRFRISQSRMDRARMRAGPRLRAIR